MESIKQLRRSLPLIRAIDVDKDLKENCLSDEILEEEEDVKLRPRRRSSMDNKKSMKKQRIDDIFKSIIKGINLKSPKSPDQWASTITIPPALINTLYSQNIRSYNPYTATLEQLEQTHSLTPFQKDRISNLCHIGIAKNFIKIKKYSMAPKYVPVNVLIRTYMRDKMWEEVKLKEETYDSVFFISTADLALTFNSRVLPKGLTEIMPKQHYTQVISEVNNIITTEYVHYKSSNLLNIAESLTGKLILGLLLILSLIFCFTQNVYLLPVIFTVGVLYILYQLQQTKDKLEKLKKLGQSKNVNATILERINAFFESIRTDMIEWRVGQDFYWLEIHYIKKKRRNYLID